MNNEENLEIVLLGEDDGKKSEVLKILTDYQEYSHENAVPYFKLVKEYDQQILLWNTPDFNLSQSEEYLCPTVKFANGFIFYFAEENFDSEVGQLEKALNMHWTAGKFEIPCILLTDSPINNISKKFSSNYKKSQYIICSDLNELRAKFEVLIQKIIELNKNIIEKKFYFEFEIEEIEDNITE